MLNNKQIYLMPFTAEAVLMYHVLKNNGITAEGFCDNREGLHGESYNGCEIMSPASAFKLNPTARVVLCAFKYYGANSAQLQKTGFSDIVFIERILKEPDAAAALPLINSEQFLKIAPRQAARLERLSYEIKNCVFPERALEDGALVIDAVDIFITERCTLKCQNCSNLMQYYKNPKHIDAVQVCRDIDLLMDKADFVRQFTVVGGEPLVHHELPEILAHISKYNGRYGQLRIVTNGTLVPPSETLSAMKTAEVFVKISDYGEHSANAARLTSALADCNIPHSLQKIEWYAWHKLISGGTSDGQAVFDRCLGRTLCKTLLNGKLYHCEFLANGENLKAFPFDEKNHIVLSECAKENIAEYLGDIKAPPGCCYCNGEDTGLPSITPAVQTAQPLPYRVFD